MGAIFEGTGLEVEFKGGVFAMRIVDTAVMVLASGALDVAVVAHLAVLLDLSVLLHQDLLVPGCCHPASLVRG